MEIVFFTSRPFSFDLNGKSYSLTNREKFLVIVSGIAGLALLGIGSIFTFYGASYLLRKRAFKKMNGKSGIRPISPCKADKKTESSVSPSSSGKTSTSTSAGKAATRSESGVGSGSLGTAGTTSKIRSNPSGKDNNHDILMDDLNKERLSNKLNKNDNIIDNYHNFVKKVKEEKGEDANVDSYVKASDTLIVWRTIEIHFLGKAYKENINYTKVEDVVSKASEFNDWCTQRAESLKTIPELDLSHKDLSFLPEQIAGLSGLRKIYLEFNRLTSVPTVIQNLNSLIEIHLNDNQITSVPKEIENCVKIRSLHLENNQISSIASEIGKLPLLRKLWLDNNQLSSLPDEIENCTLLQLLSISNNKITSIPPGIQNLKYLTKLWR